MRFASRLDQVPPYLFAELERKISAKRKEGIDVISLGIGDPDLPTPDAVVDAAAAALRDPQTHQYPSNQGTDEFREAAVGFYRERFGVELDAASEVIPVLGGKEAVGHIALACLDPGGVSLSPEPGYPPYTSGPVFAGAEVHYLPLTEANDFFPDLDAIPDDVTARANLLYLDYPNNPTGAVVPEGGFDRAVDFGRRHDLIVVHDNAYSEITFDGYVAPSFLETPGAKEVGVEIFSLSKGWNMTGWRCGLVAGNAQVIERFRGLKANLDSGLFEAIQRAAVVALTSERDFPRRMSEVYARRRDLLVEALDRDRPRRRAAEGDAVLLGAGSGRPHVGLVHLARARAGERGRFPGPRLRAERGGLRPPVADRARRAARGGRPPHRELAARGHNPGVSRRHPDPQPGAEPERGFIVAVLQKGADDERELAEIDELARTAGVDPVGRLVQHRARPDQRSYVGKGKLEELRERFRSAQAESLLVDDELTPPQQSRLEDALNARVVDRTQLILDIFAQHALSAEGKLQVELAQLQYNLPRMRGMWAHLERERIGTRGAGVGRRGPGETQLETDRRLARRRITILKRRLETLSRQRQTRRKERLRSETPTVALAGYTNVGKSTLLNALTNAEVSVHDRLFETLDATTRAFEHDGRRYLLTDTVGFIRRLPHDLVEGFAATLEETLSADLVLHVLDASAPDEELDVMLAAVEEVLTEIGAGELPVELVLNKVDAVDPLGRRRLANRFPGALQISALTEEGLAELRARIAGRFAERFELVRLLVPYEDGGKLAELYSLGTPIDEREDTEEGVFIRARLPRGELPRFAPYLIAEAAADAPESHRATR